jgi:hypothetical protein
MWSPCRLCYLATNFWMTEPISMKLGMYIMTPEPISTAYILNPSHQFVSICVSPCRRYARAREKDTAATNTRATMETFLDASFSVQPVSY